MKHVVLSTDAAGQPKIEDVDSLDEAVQLVERLRNDDAVDDVRVLREVPIEVRTYYKVVALENDGSGGAQDEPGATLPPPDVEVAGADEAPTEALQSVPDAPAPSVPDVPEPSEAAADAPQPAEQPVGAEGEPRPDARGDEGFFTPPPVRSHPIEGDGEAAPDSSPSERRTSLFGRG